MKLIHRAVTTVAAVGALVACGCYTLTTSSSGAAPPPCPSGTGAAAVRAWSACGGGDVAGDIRADLSRFSGGHLIEACARLAADVHRAQDFRPIPDARAQAHWSAALDLYGRAAADCQRGDLDLARAALQAAGDEEGQAEDRLEVLRG